MPLTDWLRKEAVYTAILSAVVSGTIGYYSSNLNDASSKIRSIKSDELSKFSLSYAATLSDVMAYIGASAKDENRSEAQKELVTQLAKLEVESQTLLDIFHNHELNHQIVEYQKNLAEFSSETRKSPARADMVRWAESFDRFNNASRILNKKIQSEIGSVL